MGNLLITFVCIAGLVIVLINANGSMPMETLEQMKLKSKHSRLIDYILWIMGFLCILMLFYAAFGIK